VLDVLQDWNTALSGELGPAAAEIIEEIVQQEQNRQFDSLSREPKP